MAAFYGRLEPNSVNRRRTGWSKLTSVNDLRLFLSEGVSSPRGVLLIGPLFLNESVQAAELAVNVLQKRRFIRDDRKVLERRYGRDCFSKSVHVRPIIEEGLINLCFGVQRVMGLICDRATHSVEDQMRRSFEGFSNGRERPPKRPQFPLRGMGTAVHQGRAAMVCTLDRGSIGTANGLGDSVCVEGPRVDAAAIGVVIETAVTLAD